MQTNVLILLFLAAFGICAGAYNWETNPGEGTPENPYQISTAEQLTAIGSDSVLLSRHFILTADLNLAGTTYTAPLIAPDMDVITPGFQGAPFSGTFDGRGYILFNLSILPASGRENIALFGNLDDAVIRNLALENVSIQAPQSDYVAALAALTFSADIMHCHVDGTVVGKNYVGGLVADDDSDTLLDNFFAGTISGSGGSFSVGGLVGTGNSGLITRCFASGNLTVGNASYDIGGLIGYINGVTVYSCDADIQITCGDNSSQIGGLVGTFDMFSDVKNCYSLGSIDAPGFANSVGGLIGNIAFNALDVRSTYSACAVRTSGGTNIGGLIGNAGGLIPTHCYFLAQADGGGPNNGTGTALTAVQMKQKSSFVGFDFLGQTSDGQSDFWRLCDNGTRYPQLSWKYSVDGDFSCPKGVGLDDLHALAAHWLEISGEHNAFHEASDANSDGIINLHDGAVLSDNWLSKSTDFDLGDVWNLAANWLSTNATWEQGDYTGDRKVNLADFSILSQSYQPF